MTNLIKLTDVELRKLREDAARHDYTHDYTDDVSGLQVSRFFVNYDEVCDKLDKTLHIALEANKNTLRTVGIQQHGTRIDDKRRVLEHVVRLALESGSVDSALLKLALEDIDEETRKFEIRSQAKDI